MEKGSVSKMHVSRAIRMLPPREFISRNRSQRHIASGYLPGKSPLDPNHDILKFSDVAIKSSKGKENSSNLVGLCLFKRSMAVIFLVHLRRKEKSSIVGAHYMR